MSDELGESPDPQIRRRRETVPPGFHPQIEGKVYGCRVCLDIIRSTYEGEQLPAIACDVPHVGWHILEWIIVTGQP